MIKRIPLFSDDGSQAAGLAHLIDSLKIKAVDSQTDFILHIDASASQIRVTSQMDETPANQDNPDEEPDQENEDQPLHKPVALDAGTKILEVQFADDRKPQSLEYQIRFRKQGYSDFVYIHLTENDKNLTLAVAPFLPQTRILNRHVYFEKCN